VAQVALAQKPLEVAVAGRANSFAAQRGALVAVALRVDLIGIAGSGRDRGERRRTMARLAGQRIGTRMIFGRNTIQCELEAAPRATAEVSAMSRTAKSGPDHSAPPLDELDELDE